MVVNGASPPRLRRLRKKTACPLVHTNGTQEKNIDDAALEQRGAFLLKARHPDYVVIANGLGPAALTDLEEFLKTQKLESAKMKNENTGEDDDERKVIYDDRDCQTAWFHARRDCPWLQKQLVRIVRDVGNAEWPLFKINKYTGDPMCEWEQTQYTVYAKGQHFSAWHQDAYADGHDQEDARQLAIVVMVTKKEDYSGGLFEMKLPATSGRKGMILRKGIKLDAGDVIVFPAKKLIHRVKPVTRGIRRTLVTWASDRQSCLYYNPKFKRKTKVKGK